MLPYTDEGMARFIAAIEAKKCEKKMEFMKNPPLLFAEQPRVFLFSDTVDSLKVERHLKKLTKEVSKEFKIAFPYFKQPKLKLPILHQEMIDEIAARGEIWKLPLLQAIAGEVEEIMFRKD